jgi:electron transfer flavoprotein alpha subunit
MTVLCLLEIDANGVIDPSMSALDFARSLAESADHDPADFSGADTEKSARSWSDLAVAWFGPVTATDHAALAAAGVSRGYAIGSDELAGYAPLAWARALAGLAAASAVPAESAAPAAAEVSGSTAPVSAVVAASTDRGNEVLAHLAALAGLPMAANCVSASWAEPAQCRLVRQRWAGSLLEDAVLTGAPALLTVATDALGSGPDVADADAGLAGAGEPALTVEAYAPELAGGDLVVRAVESAGRAGGVSLATARVVVGGGRGVGSAEGFAALEELAGLLGAAVGVSRVVTSQGWRPHKQQVGQTGTRITPELYLACGISGAIQHMAGCQSAKNIIAINTDAGAPIVARADYAVIGDLHQVIPALVAALRARSARS